MTSDPVELIPAYVYDCPECGRENFVRGVVVDLPPDEMTRMREEFGYEPWDDGLFLTIPNTVTCKWCASVFSAVDFRNGDFED